jgi:hypothetical protein
MKFSLRTNVGARNYVSGSSMIARSMACVVLVLIICCLPTAHNFIHDPTTMPRPILIERSMTASNWPETSESVHYTTSLAPPCTYARDATLQPLKCIKIQAKIVGFSDPHTAVTSSLMYSGLWPEDILPECTHVDVWVLHFNLLTSPRFYDAVAALPNVPSVLAVDQSGEVGEVDAANCMFNALRNNTTVKGFEKVNFVLASQATSIFRHGQRTFNQHWLVPTKLADLTSAAHENSHFATNDSSRIICLGGYSRPHKLEFLAELDARGLLNQILWSAGSPDKWTITYLEPHMHDIGYRDQEIQKTKSFLNALPHILDADWGTSKASEMTFVSELYNRAPVHLVVESNNRIPSLDRHPCTRTFRYTEKTLKAIYSSARFILFGDPASLELLRSHGFRTFHPHINETYDIIPTYSEKIDAIALEIQRIISMDKRAFMKFLRKTKSIVAHNKNWVISAEFKHRVFQQSLHAYGIQEQAGFDTTGHARAIAKMYSTLRIDC